MCLFVNWGKSIAQWFSQSAMCAHSMASLRRAARESIKAQQVVRTYVCSFSHNRAQCVQFQASHATYCRHRHSGSLGFWPRSWFYLWTVSHTTVSILLHKVLHLVSAPSLSCNANGESRRHGLDKLLQEFRFACICNVNKIVSVSVECLAYGVRNGSCHDSINVFERNSIRNRRQAIAFVVVTVQRHLAKQKHV